MSENDEALCPIMTTEKNEYYCGDNCEWYNEQFERCSIFVIGQMSGLQIKDIIGQRLHNEEEIKRMKEKLNKQYGRFTQE